MSTSQGYEYQSEFARKYWSQGREEGREEGRISATAEAVIKVLAGRDLDVSDSEREVILTCTDLSTLDRWLVQALTASSVEDLLRTDPPAPGR